MKPMKTAFRHTLTIVTIAMMSGCSTVAEFQTAVPTSSLAHPSTGTAPTQLENNKITAAQRHSRKIYGAEIMRSTVLEPDLDRQPPVSQTSTDAYTLDLNNTDIRDLATLILGTILNRNYVIEEGVEGTVSIHTPAKIRKEDLMPLLRAAVRSRGADLLDDGQLVSIVSAGTDSQLGFGSANRLEIMPIVLKNASATQMYRVLLPLARDLVDIAIDEQTNMLVLAGSFRHMIQLRELAETLDVDSTAGQSMRLMALENANVDQVLDEIAKMTDVGGIVRLIPIKRLNAVFAMSEDVSRLAQLESWMRLLDQNGGKDFRNVYVYEALSGDVSELALTASSVLGLASTAAEQPPAFAENPQLVEPPAALGESSSFFAPENVPDELIGSTREIPSSPQDEDGLPRIVPDTRGGQIIAYATASEWQRISTVLNQLDQMPQQVMIEATIVEVSLNDSLRYGLQFLFGGGDTSVSLPAFESAGLSASPGNGFNFTFDNGQSTQVILDALSSVTDVNVISSPRLMVLSNETATLQIGDQVPVALQSAVPIEANDNRIINSIEFRDTGVILRVTPNVGSSNTILIEVDQEISDVAATTSSNIDSPTIRQRRVSSKLSVEDGETIAFAGLTRNSTSSVKNGIPIARELPLVGPLFGSTEKVSSRSELLILLTPRIVRNLDDARTVTNELKSRIGQLVVSSSEGQFLN